MLHSAADIAAISTGRETVLIGPYSAFVSARADVAVLRNRAEVAQLLRSFLSRQNAEALVRPWLRRWGFDPGTIANAGGASLFDMLARAAESGRIAVAVTPEVTLAFSPVAERQAESVRRLSLKPKTDAAQGLPSRLEDRMLIVLSMVPDHLNGETRIAFNDLVKNVGVEMLATGIVIWIAAHFVPGVNIAVLALDLFTLSGDVINAIGRIADAVDAIRRAKSRSELQIVAKALAAALAVLIANGVLSRFLKAKGITKAIGKRTGALKKPAPPKKAARKAQRTAKEHASDERPAKHPSRTGGFQPKKRGQKEDGAEPWTARKQAEIETADNVRRGDPLKKDGWPELSADHRANFNGDPKPVDLPKGTKIYRVIDAESNPNGSYWSLEPPPKSEGAWRAGSAVKNNWNGDGMYVEHTVGEGGLKGWAGPARAQLSSDNSSILPGGANQLVIPENSLPGTLAPKPTPWNTP